MSKPTSNSVTPKSSKSATPVLPPCSIPYRKKLYIGYGLSFYCDPEQPPAIWASHRHPETQVLVFGGEADCTVHWKERGHWQKREVAGACIWILAARVAHRLDWRSHALRAAIYLEPRFAQETAGHSIKGSRLWDLNALTSRDVRILHEMRRFAKNSEPRTPVEILKMKSAGTVLTTLLLQALDQIDSAPKTTAPALPDSVFARVAQMIEEHMEEKVLIPDMAKAVHMSRSCFHRQFKRRIGVSPGVYLISRRIVRAIELLDATDRTVCDIALSVGFNSQSYFDRCFKKVTGRTPTQHRGNR